MNEREIIKGLARRADAAALPTLDVTENVLREIAVRRSEDNRLVGVFALVTSGAAAVAASFAWAALSDNLDPLNQLVSSFTMVLQ